jgi:hypothetical protein
MKKKKQTKVKKLTKAQKKWSNSFEKDRKEFEQKIKETRRLKAVQSLVCVPEIAEMLEKKEIRHMFSAEINILQVSASGYLTQFVDDVLTDKSVTFPLTLGKFTIEKTKDQLIIKEKNKVKFEVGFKKGYTTLRAVQK